MAEQKQRLGTLCLNFRTMSGIMGPLSSNTMLSVLEDTDVFASQSGANGAFVVPKESVVELVENSFSRAIADLRSLGTHAHEHVVRSIKEMLLSALIQLFPLQSERSTDHSPSLHFVASVLPAQVYALRPRQFFGIVETQTHLLRMSRGAEHVVVLKDEFSSFKRYAAGSLSALQSLQEYDNCIAGGIGAYKRRGYTFTDAFQTCCNFSEGWLL